MAQKKKENISHYDESKIKTLSSLEHIRIRSGMYIGRLGNGDTIDDGIYVLLKEIIDNSIDEFIVGNGRCIEIQKKDVHISVRDYGRGIPLGKVIDCVSIINTGAKYNTDVFQFSVGLNGVGTKAVNALSSHFLVRSFRDGKGFQARFSQGKLIDSADIAETDEKNGTYIEFIPDEQIFGSYNFIDEYIIERIHNYTYLNTGLVLWYNGQKFVSQKGLYDLLAHHVENEHLYQPVHYKSEKLEFTFTHTTHYGEDYFSFVNGQHTNDGGTHQSAFREGILKGINEFFGKSFSGADVRDGIVGAVAIKIMNPIFESQTKNKLGNSDIRAYIVSEVRAAVEDYLHKNIEIVSLLQEKILHNERLRKELNAVKKEAKEAARKISLKIPNLRDCKHHLGDSSGHGEQSMIFITEGHSAAGSMISSRDVHLQALFSMRGKPQNVFGKKRADIYRNAELYNMMMALGIEQETTQLRYGKIIIATDADNDGFHIRNLLLTFFLNYFENLIYENRIFILETPLFRVRNKQKTIYCYSEKERNAAISTLKNNIEITRFKGLGEISPKEFGQFIKIETMRLVPVLTKTIHSMHEMLEFYMGRNTPERKHFIMDNLISYTEIT